MLGGADLLLCAQALELGGGAGGENLEDRKAPRLFAHHARIEHREMAEHASAAVHERHAEKTLDAHLL